MSKLLEDAAKITSGDRRRDYGRPLINHIRIAIKGSVTFEHNISPAEVAWFMGADLKSARDIQTPKWDNYLDNVGYMVCMEDMANQLIELNYCETQEEALQWLHSATVPQMWDCLMDLSGQSARVSIHNGAWNHIDMGMVTEMLHKMPYRPDIQEEEVPFTPETAKYWPNEEESWAEYYKEQQNKDKTEE